MTTTLNTSRIENRYLSATLPREPLQGSVVLDKDGVAWQRTNDDGWFPTALLFGPARKWLVLLAESGPVRLLWDAPALAVEIEPECAECAEAETTEPPVGARVRDNDRDVWTRESSGRWYFDGLHYAWDALLKDYGPVTRLRAEESA